MKAFFSEMGGWVWTVLATCIVGVLVISYAESQEVERSNHGKALPGSVIAANTVLTVSDLGKRHTVQGAPVIRIPNPSGGLAYYLDTEFCVTGSGVTLFMTGGSFNPSGTTIWTTNSGANLKIKYEKSGVSVFVERPSGTWTVL